MLVETYQPEVLTPSPKVAPVKETGPDYVALEMAARFVDRLPEEQFSFNEIVATWDAQAQCGTVCCVIGWTPRIFPDRVRWGEDVEVPSTADPRLVVHHRGWAPVRGEYLPFAMQLFRLSFAEAGPLFCPGMPLPWFDGRVALTDAQTLFGVRSWRPTAKNVAASIRAYIAWKQTGQQADPDTVLH